MRWPSTTFGPVHPFGVASTIIGQRGASRRRSPRAVVWIARMSAIDPIERVRHQPMHRRRIVAFDEVRHPAVAAQQLLELARAGCGRAPSGLAIL